MQVQIYMLSFDVSCSNILQSMVAGVIGSHSPNVPAHVAEVHRHVKGIATIKVRHMAGCLV